jgi:hypothetical protein
VLTGFWWGKKPLDRPGHRLEDTIKLDNKIKSIVGMDWIDLAQERDT